MKSIYMDENWGSLQQDKENGESVTYVYEQDGMRVIYPFIKREAGIVDGVQFFDLVTPRGQCGPWIENGDGTNIQMLIEEFNDDFHNYCIEEKVVAEYVKFSPWLGMSHNFSRIYDIDFYGFVFCNDLTRDFFNEEYKPAKRRNVRKAEKSGVEIVIDSKESSIDEFLEVYAFTENKYNVSDYYKLNRDFLKKYLELFPEEILFAKAIYDGKIISAAIILMGEDIAHYHFGASDPAYTSLQANSLLFYRAAQFAAQKGKSLFDLGSAKAGSTLEKFKKDISKGYQCHLGKKVRNEGIYATLIEQAGGPRENYFPAYRRG